MSGFEERPRPDRDGGLCESCRHSRIVVAKGGSLFRLCERSRMDPRYPRYPPLPVLDCDGFEPGFAPDAVR